VIRMIQQGKINKEIAYLLHKSNGESLTEGTIKVYISTLFKKMGVTNRTELAVRADAILAERSTFRSFSEQPAMIPVQSGARLSATAAA